MGASSDIFAKNGDAATAKDEAPYQHARAEA
jgi:hypothetical protein